MKWTNELIEKVSAQVTEKAAKDPEFAEKLLADPKQAIEEATGYVLPDGYEIKVVKENGILRAVNSAAVDVLSDEELGEVAGGYLDRIDIPSSEVSDQNDK